MGWIDQTRPEWVLARPPRVVLMDDEAEGEEPA
jgi:hypothetical protein